MAGAASPGDCLECPAGYECIAHGIPSPCAVGTYSTVNSTSCAACNQYIYIYIYIYLGTAGYYCMLGIRYDCDSNSGYYAYGSAYYQDEGSATNCKYVPPGSEKAGRAAISPCGSNISTGGSASCSSCPGNTICSGDLNVRECPPGTTMNAFKCDLCSAGNYCIGGTTTTQSVNAAGNRYFVAGVAQYQIVVCIIYIYIYI